MHENAPISSGRKNLLERVPSSLISRILKNALKYRIELRETIPEKKLVVFLGEGGTGKTTLISELQRKHGDQFKKVITCTSRPRRPGEIDGVDYHFLPKEYFIDNPDLVLTGQSSEGHYYGTKRNDLYSKKHHILLPSRPSGVNYLFKLGFENLVVIQLKAQEETRIKRMREREDTEEKITKRLEADKKNTERGLFNLQKVTTIEINSENETVEEEVEKIFKYLS